MSSPLQDDSALPALLESLHLPAGLTEGTLAQSLEQVLAAATEILGVDAVGLMLVADGERLRRVATTDRLAQLVEEVQVDLRQGPGIDAVRGDHAVAVADLEHCASYAGLWRALQEVGGPRAVLAAPVRVAGRVEGNLNALRLQAHEWTADQVRASGAYADVIGVLLGLAAQSAQGPPNHP